jgi:hypothetical protein
MVTITTGAALASLIGVDAPVALNDWYERNVGYRPQVDDPAMSDDELRTLCLGMAAEMDFHGEPPR